jgi:hypothetical protein
MTRQLWPSDEESPRNELRALIEDAAATVGEYVREDRYGLLEVRLHARAGRIRTYIFGARHLPLSQTDGWRFLAHYAPEELDTIALPESPRGVLSVGVRGAHTRGDLTEDEERELLSRLGLTPEDVRRDLEVVDEA